MATHQLDESVATATERLYSKEQAAKILGIGVTKLYKLMGTGELRSVKLGRHRRIPASAINELIEGLG